MIKNLTPVISSGQTDSGDSISNAVLTVDAGGTAIDLLIGSAAAEEVFGVDFAAVLEKYGSWQRIYSGGQASGVTISGGKQVIYSGGIAINTTAGALSGNSQQQSADLEVYSGGTASGTVVGWLGDVGIFSGAVGIGLTATNGGFIGVAGSASGTFLSAGSEEVDGGTDSGAEVLSGAQFVADPGGTAISATVIDGRQIVLSGGSAAATMLSGTPGSSGTQEVSSGSVASDTIVASGGIEWVSSGGTGLSTDVEFGGLLVVLSGGTVNSGTIGSGGLAYVSGAINDTDVAAGGSLIVTPGAMPGHVISETSADIYSSGVVWTSRAQVMSAGLAVSGAIVTSDEREVILPGGIASATTILSGGSVDVYAGGTGLGTVINGGSRHMYSGGTALGTTLSGGQDYLDPGAFASDTVLSGGAQTVAGMVSRTTISSGAFQAVYGSALDTTVSSGGLEDVYYGTSTDTIVLAGGSAEVKYGGILAGKTQLDGILTFTFEPFFGAILTDFGGIASGSGAMTVTQSGTVVLTSAANIGQGITVVISGGTLELQSGAVVSGPITFAGSGGTLKIDGTTMPSSTISGLAPGDTIDLAGVSYTSGGTVVLGAGNDLIITEGAAYGLQLDRSQNFGGDRFHLSDDGAGGTNITVSSGPDIVSAGQALVVSAGQVSSGIVIDSGGFLTVLSGGIASGSIISSGGDEQVSAGGGADGTVVSAGGTIGIILGSAYQYAATGANVIGGITIEPGATVQLNVASGGSMSGFVADFGGFDLVASGGTAAGTIVRDGSEQALPGGVLDGPVISGGGFEFVFSGGSIDSPRIAGGTLELQDGFGSVVGGAVIFAGSGGELTIDGTAMPSSTISGLAPGDTIALAGVPYTSGGTVVLGTGNKLTVTEGTSYTLQLDPAQNFAVDTFQLSSDGAGGTDVTVLAAARPSVGEDFNGDRRSDVLLHSTANGSFVDWTMSGAVITAAENLVFNGNTVALDPSWSVAGVRDLDGDGRSDILLKNTSGSFADWAMNGSTIAAAQALMFNGASVALDPTWSVSGVGDFSGDARADILLHNTDGSFVLWTMSGATITAAQNVTFNGAAVALDPSWSVAATGDLNGDGEADILLRSTNGQLVDWTMSGAAIVAAQNITFGGAAVGLDNSWSVLGAGDFDGDNKADILLYNTNGSFVDWGMNGATIMSAADLAFQGNPVTLDSSWTFADIGDYNGDGKADILLRNSNGAFTDWTMNGATITAADNLTFNGNPVTLDSSWRTN